MKPLAAWLIMLGLILAIPVGVVPLHAESKAEDAGAAMRARYEAIRDQLDNSQFEQPIHLRSDFKDERIHAELSGVIRHPFETASPALKSAGNWCDIMMLHLNVKFCCASKNGSDQILTVFLGRKYPQPLESAHRVDYCFCVLDNNPDYFKMALTLDRGPFQTRNYHIQLEAIPTDHGQTFIRFIFSYDFGSLAQTAKSVYFSTVARDKVGFTVVDTGADGQPVYIGGLRGAVERNIMRFYLAIKAHLDALDVPPSERFEKQLQDWFELTERYPLQLRELDKKEYMRMKKQEKERRDALPCPYTQDLPD